MNPRTNGESKAIQTKSQTEAYTYTLTKRGKGAKLIYPVPKVHLLYLGWFVVYSGIQQMQVHQVVCGALIRCFWGCWEKFPFLVFVCTAPGVQLWIWPASACRSPEGVCSSLTQDGVKGAAALAHSCQGEGRVQMRGEPVAAEASITLQQLEACRAFSRGSCSSITGPWQWWAVPAPGRDGVDSDLCSHTGFLVAAAAALASHAHLWGPRW